MGASDFLSGGGPRAGTRVLADSALGRRPSEPDTSGRRLQVLQRHGAPTQLSLFSLIESRSHRIDPADTDSASGIASVVNENPSGPAPTLD